MEANPQAGQSWVLNTFLSRTQNLVYRPMHVSDRPKRPNMVPRPNLGGDSIFHSLPWSTPKGQGALPCAHTPHFVPLKT